jgi:hypothetical protein
MRFLFLFFLVVLEFELRAYTLSHFYVMGFLKIGSFQLFAWTGFKSCSSDICLLSS